MAERVGTARYPQEIVPLTTGDKKFIENDSFILDIPQSSSKGTSGLYKQVCQIFLKYFFPLKKSKIKNFTHGDNQRFARHCPYDFTSFMCTSHAAKRRIVDKYSLSTNVRQTPSFEVASIKSH